MNLYLSRTFLLFCGSTLAAAPTEENRWPQFRGPHGSGVAATTGLPAQWSGQDHLQWKVASPGRGWSCPIVWDDKVILTAAYSIEETPAETGGDGDSQDYDRGERGRQGGGGGGRGPDTPPDTMHRFEVVCLSTSTGESLWKTAVLEAKPRIPTHRSNTYASETPVTDGERIYAYFGMHGLYCLDMQGKLLWQADPPVRAMVQGWGTSSSPVLHGGLVFLQIDNEEESVLLAYDCKTGEEQWGIPRDEPSNWASPLIWQNSKRTELITCGSRKAIAYDPMSGAVLWELSQGGRSSATPVADGDVLFIGTAPQRERRGGRGGPGGGGPGGAGGGAAPGGPVAAPNNAGGGSLFAVKAGAEGDITPKEGESTSSGVLWSQPRSGPTMSSPLYYQGNIYILESDGGMLSCYDAATGAAHYVKERLPDAGAFWASPWASDGKVFCLDEDGNTFVLKAGSKLELLGKNSIADQFWSTPALAHNRLILRGVESVYCIQP